MSSLLPFKILVSQRGRRVTVGVKAQSKAALSTPLTGMSRCSASVTGHRVFFLPLCPGRLCSMHGFQLLDFSRLVASRHPDFRSKPRHCSHFNSRAWGLGGGGSPHLYFQLSLLVASRNPPLPACSTWGHIKIKIKLIKLFWSIVIFALWHSVWLRRHKVSKLAHKPVPLPHTHT